MFASVRNAVALMHVAFLVRPGAAAEPLAAKTVVRSVQRPEVGGECGDPAECAAKAIVRAVARPTKDAYDSGVGPAEVLPAATDEVGREPRKPVVRRTTRDDEETPVFSGTFMTEIGIGCIGFSFTVLMQRYFGEKSRTVRKTRRQPGTDFDSFGKKTNVTAGAAGTQRPELYNGGAAGRNGSKGSTSTHGNAAGPHEKSPVPSQVDETEVWESKDKLLKAGMRKLLALVTSKPALKEIPSLVLRSIAAIEARTGEPLSSKHTLDLLIQLLRACASSKCFKEGLAAFDCLEQRVGTANHNLWSLLLYVATEAGAYERSEGFYSRLQGSPGPDGRDFVNVVRAFAKRQDMGGLQASLESIRQSGHEGMTLDRVVRNRALAACCKEGAVDLAVAVAETDVFRKPLDNVGYNTLITCFARSGDYRRSFKTFDEMEAKGVQPTEATFGSLLEACCGANDVSRSKYYLSKIKGYGLTVNAVHCTALIKALVADKHLADAARLLEELTHDRDVTLDIIVFYTMIKAFTDNADLKAALRVYESMGRHGVHPDEFVFNALINGCSIDSTVSVTDLNSLMQKLLQDGLKPTTTTLSIMLKAMASCGAWDNALELLETAPDRFHSKVETRLYVQLAQAAIKSGCKEKAIEIHDAMVLTQGRKGQDGKAASRWLLRQCDVLPHVHRPKHGLRRPASSPSIADQQFAPSSATASPRL